MALNIKPVYETHNKFFFLAKGTSIHLLNLLRRTIISSLPAFAIDEVTFYENNSGLFNEYLANRLALIPLSFEENTQDDAKIIFELNVECLEGEKTVYSSELTSTDAAIKAFAQHVPVVKLAKNQRLRLEAVAVKGIGKQHAKFQSAIASYGAASEFKAAGKCSKCENPLQRIIPLDATQAKKSGLPDACFQCDDCLGKSKKDLPDDEYVFQVESFNNLSAREQLLRAIRLTEKDAKELAKEIKS